MRILAITILGALLLPPRAHAEAGGCLKYGAVGAVAGHTVGHGVKGAAVGCVTGMVVRHRARKDDAAKSGLATEGQHGALTPH